jgi:hypothetical protein
MSEIVFVRDTVMSRDTFEQLPACASDGDKLVEMVKAFQGRLCRAMLEREGIAGWHAIAWHDFNGAERAVATRVIVRTYQAED